MRRTYYLKFIEKIANKQKRTSYVVYVDLERVQERGNNRIIGACIRWSLIAIKCREAI